MSVTSVKSWWRSWALEPLNRVVLEQTLYPASSASLDALMAFFHTPLRLTAMSCWVSIPSRWMTQARYLEGGIRFIIRSSSRPLVQQ